ncbi:MAG: transposase [Candidatus Binatia bacterium]
MCESSKAGRADKAEVTFDRDTIERSIRKRVRGIIEQVVEAELDAALGAQVSQRVGKQRQRYRHGYRERTLTTSTGRTTSAMPRAQLRERDGRSHEWRSQAVARYARRSRRVGEAIVGVYLSGANARHSGVSELAVVDGTPGLTQALQEQWKKIRIQRCTNHTLRNLQAKAPARLRAELTEDFRRMIHAESVDEITKQRKKFAKKWRLKCAAAAETPTLLSFA